MALSIVLASALTTTGGQFVAGYIDGEERGHNFLGPNAVTPTVANSLPVTVSVAQTSIVDAAGNTKTGGFQVNINPNANDTVNYSSPQSLYLDTSAIFIIASTSNG